jgi:GNAT superfamily N-acetyltransferase
MALETLPPTLEVVRHQAGDQEDIFRFYAETFGQDLTEGSRRRWQWQYAENPRREAEGPSIWVAREGTSVLGQYASMPVALHWGGREVRSSWGMDVFLRPEARGKGVGARLFTAWSDHVEVALGLGLTPSSYGLFKKLAYHDVGPVPFFQKVLDARAVARRRLGGVAGTLRAPLPLARLGAAVPRSPAGLRGRGRAHRRRSGRSSTRCGSARVLRTRCACAGTRRTCSGSTRPVRTVRTTSGRRGPPACCAGSRSAGTRTIAACASAGSSTSSRTPPTRTRRTRCSRPCSAPSGRRASRARRRSRRTAPLGDALRRRGFRQAPSPMQFCVRTRVESEPLTDPGRWHVVFGDSDMDR